METKVVTPAELVEIVERHKVSHTVFGVRFTKKDGSDRIMACRFGVKSHLRTAGTPSTVSHKPEYITVFDMKKQAYRNVSLSRLTYLVSKQIKYILH